MSVMSKYKFNITFPTEEELKVSAKKWFEPLKNIGLNKWNSILIDNSFPFEIYPIKENIIDILISDGNANLDEAIEYFNSIIGKSKFESPYFIKLISRSPKDYLYDNMALSAGKDIASALSSSMRTFEDLCRFKYLPEESFLVLRPFIKLKRKYEFRVFVYENKINGISQYYYENSFNYSKEELVKIEKDIRDFTNDILIPNCEEDTFVVDLYCDKNVKLIEINPYYLSDPCLFYSYDNLKDEFLVKDRD